MNSSSSELIFVPNPHTQQPSISMSLVRPLTSSVPLHPHCGQSATPFHGLIGSYLRTCDNLLSSKDYTKCTRMNACSVGSIELCFLISTIGRKGVSRSIKDVRWSLTGFPKLTTFVPATGIGSQRRDPDTSASGIHHWPRIRRVA
jgi:hypothetical protein